MTDELKLPTDPDAQRCLKCGKDALDTGWECTECGYDNMPWYRPQVAQQPAAVECPHRTRCDCLCSCKYGMAGDGALAGQQGGES